MLGNGMMQGLSLPESSLHARQEALSAKRLRWLSYHDQQTAGIMGLLPLVRGLPVRLTESINRGLKLFKHRRGTVVGWTLHPDVASEVEGG